LSFELVGIETCSILAGLSQLVFDKHKPNLFLKILSLNTLLSQAFINGPGGSAFSAMQSFPASAFAPAGA